MRSSFLWVLVDCKFITCLKRYLIFNYCWFTQEFNCLIIATTPPPQLFRRLLTTSLKSVIVSLTRNLFYNLKYSIFQNTSSLTTKYPVLHKVYFSLSMSYYNVSTYLPALAAHRLIFQPQKFQIFMNFAKWMTSLCILRTF